MKRIRSGVQLRLERETLRRLDKQELAQVAAGSGLGPYIPVPVPPIVIGNGPSQPIPGQGPIPPATKLASDCNIWLCGPPPSWP